MFTSPLSGQLSGATIFTSTFLSFKPSSHSSGICCLSCGAPFQDTDSIQLRIASYSALSLVKVSAEYGFCAVLTFLLPCAVCAEQGYRFFLHKPCVSPLLARVTHQHQIRRQYPNRTRYISCQPNCVML